ncbi:MAG: hypothetical protein WD426_15260 [Anditalea sp.]
MGIQSQKFESWIRSKFEETQRKEVVYHNLSHSEFIVEKVAEIAKYFELPEQDQEDLFITAWLHDVGYLNGKGSGHEQRGAELAQTCLKELGLHRNESTGLNQESWLQKCLNIPRIYLNTLFVMLIFII